ncbi:GNAT family N-acetyltransferase [Paenibacillus cellulositrophicus]|uniref:GNAT family N-acetyltransferase n=1 Tax=Paenibacillus cellulositrophicus TaxID=562959 RepID=UPI0012676BEB|nr:GNAT family N-acetyltransferase [Paenibacillus cellulositrophicus]
MSKYRLKQAEQELFAVYQVIYSDADIEMWYDWNSRLDDTKFTDQCFWIMRDDERIGGAIINNGTVMYPFLISPHVDRSVFWKALFSCCNDIVHIKGVLQKDIDILLTFAYRLDVIRQVMCCPTDTGITTILPKGYSMHILNDSIDSETVGKVIMEGYSRGIDNEIFGATNEAEVIKDAMRLMQIYAHRNLSICVFDEKEQEIAGLCIAGISENMPLGFAEIGEICVLPKYRNKGLAETMLKHVRANAHKYAQVVKLCVTVGNYAENLYRKNGFYPGPRFANMSKRLV